MNRRRKTIVALLVILVIHNSSYITAASFNTKAAGVGQKQASLAGTWKGLIDSAGLKLHLILKLIKSADGGYRAVVNSTDQSGDLDLVVDTVTLRESTLRFEMKDLSAVYEGTVSADGLEIVGRWTQGGSVVLIFRRDDSAGRAIKPFKRGSLNLEPCKLSNLTQNARCGKFEVFEDRTAAKGRKIALNIMILPASSDKPLADPVFYLAGGPGQGAASVASEAGDFLPGIHRERDLVLVDQRGTGASNPLNCNINRDRDDMRTYFATTDPVDALRQCRAELEKVANLALYTTTIAMDDLDDVRAALGYDRINLYGGSYGTNAALVYMRQHPDRVRSAVLKGVAPTDFKMPLYFAKSVQHATDRVFEDCARDEKCGKTFPNLKAEFIEILSRLDKEPIKVDVLNVVTNKPQQISMTRTSFVEGLRMMLYEPTLASTLPLMIHQAHEGDFAPFAAYAFILIRQIEPQLASGMGTTVICSEHVPFITEADITREVTGTYYGDARVRVSQKLCQEWPVVKAAASFTNPVKSDVPILMISGEIDPVTPPWIAANAARLLPNAMQVIIHDGTHLTQSPCIQNLIYEFVSKGSGTRLDTSCVNNIKRPPFTYAFPISFKPSTK